MIARMFVYLAITSMMIAGCRGANDPGEADQPIAGSQTTPEDTFKNFRNAALKDDWNEAFLFLTDKSQDTLLGLMVIGASAGVAFGENPAREESFNRLLKNHGIDLADTSPAPSNNPVDAMTAFVGSVKNKGKCMGAVLAWINENMTEPMDDSPARQIAKSELGPVTVEGNRAMAIMHVDGRPDPSPTIFTRQGDRWYLDLAASMVPDVPAEPPR